MLMGAIEKGKSVERNDKEQSAKRIAHSEDNNGEKQEDHGIRYSAH